MRHAVIDIGTHSARLLVVDARDGRLDDLHRSVVITKLGVGVDRTRVLSDEGVQRTLAAVRQFGDICSEYGVVSGKAVATSALRDVSNGMEFLDQVVAISGLPATIINGQQEAEYSFNGAIAGFSDLEPDTDVVMVDIGGGSTEVVLGGTKGLRESVSLDIGCLRLTERFINTDPPRVDETAALYEFACEEIEGHTKKFPADAMMIGVAGTITTLYAIANEIEPYDRELVNHGVLTVDDIEEVLRIVSSIGLGERKKILGLQPGRADVIVAGAVIARAVLKCGGMISMTVSESDLLDGVVGELIA